MAPNTEGPPTSTGETAIATGETAIPTGETVGLPSEGARDDRVRCVACAHELTTRASAIDAGGAHNHRFRNPAGWSFQIRCFSDAPGCRAAGDLTEEATWFSGYAWSFALCGGCGSHVGWWWVGAGHSFAGLIVQRIR